MYYYVASDDQYNATHKRDRLTIWTGPFASEFIADATSLPKRDGYMIVTRAGKRIRVACEVGRTDANFSAIDSAINAALTAQLTETSAGE